MCVNKLGINKFKTCVSSILVKTYKSENMLQYKGEMVKNDTDLIILNFYFILISFFHERKKL